MNNALTCFGEKTTAAVAGFVLVVIGIVFLGLGLTVLPGIWIYRGNPGLSRLFSPAPGRF